MAFAVEINRKLHVKKLNYKQWQTCDTTIFIIVGLINLELVHRVNQFSNNRDRELR